MRLSSNNRSELDAEWRESTSNKQKSKTSIGIGRLATKIVQVKDVDQLASAINVALPANGTVWVDDNEKKWNGSGFLLKNSRFITAHHVIEGLSNEAKISIVFDKDGKTFSATVASEAPEIDVAILVLDQQPEGIRPIMFANPGDITVGEEVAVVGSPGGWQDVVSTGRVSAIDQSLGNLEQSLSNFILIDADIEPGSSGSMVIDTDSNIVGMVSAMIGEHAELGVGKKAVIPVAQIINVIKESHAQ